MTIPRRVVGVVIGFSDGRQLAAVHVVPAIVGRQVGGDGPRPRLTDRTHGNFAGGVSNFGRIKLCLCLLVGTDYANWHLFDCNNLSLVQV